MISLLSVMLVLMSAGGVAAALVSVIVYLLVHLRELRIRVVKLEHAVKRLEPDPWRAEEPVQEETGVREPTG